MRQKPGQVQRVSFPIPAFLRVPSYVSHIPRVSARSLIGIVVQALTALSIFLSLFTASGGLQKSVCDSCPIVNVVDSTIAPFDSTGVTRYEGTATSCEDYVATQVLGLPKLARCLRPRLAIFLM